MTPLNKKIIEDFNYALIKSFGEEYERMKKAFPENEKKSFLGSRILK